MTTDHERRDLADIEALSIEFWYRVDHQNGVGVADLFTEDGVYSVANGESAGRAAIAESYVQRAARGPRLSRQMPISVTDVEDEYVKESEGVWLIRHRHLSQVFLGDRPGVLPMGAPSNASEGGR